jgi:hypothetical protein
VLGLFLGGSLGGGWLLGRSLGLLNSLNGSLLGLSLLLSWSLGLDLLGSSLWSGGLWLAGASLGWSGWGGGDVGQWSVVDDLAGRCGNLRLGSGWSFSLDDLLGDTAGLLALAGRSGDWLAGGSLSSNTLGSSLGHFD